MNLDVLDEFGGIATYDGVWSNVLGNNSAGSYYGILADGHTRQDDGTYADPCIAADVDGLAAKHHAVLEVVVVGDDAHVGTYHHTIVDGDAACSHTGERMVDKHASADLHLTGEIDLQRGHQIAGLVEAAIEERLFERTYLLGHGCRRVDLETDVCAVGHVLDCLCIFGCRHVDIGT